MVKHGQPLARQRLRWLILAPHADDETLGAGALIAQSARAGLFAGLIYLTDGSGSHAEPVGNLITVRKREAATALRRLAGREAPPPLYLGWKDAAPAQQGSRAFDRAAQTLAALCRRKRIDALAVTALHEPHCDHAAAAQLAYAIQKYAKRAMIVAEYLVWSEAPAARSHRTLSTAPMLAGQRRHALSAHRSQLTPSHGPGFRLPMERRRMPTRDTLYLRKAP